ncbi:hypothetical protein AVEN_244540-1 [Araneus ventricosus]|uniref:Uncharacterized protein n=1 Tax=Araneus ventricosus TaxID=182803 RepID=A0A4Y2F540_ARAVE|nr:hypothetical protein AVEN_244540-1 [Araneus ventricosus]
MPRNWTEREFVFPKKSRTAPESQIKYDISSASSIAWEIVFRTKYLASSSETEAHKYIPECFARLEVDAFLHPLKKGGGGANDFYVTLVAGYVLSERRGRGDGVGRTWN